MYSLGDLQPLYQLLNQEWNSLMYGAAEETLIEQLLSWLHNFGFYIWELMGYTAPRNRGHYSIGVIIVMTLAITFFVYKVMAEVLSFDSRKRASKRNLHVGRINGSAIVRELLRSLEETLVETGTTLVALIALVKPTLRTFIEQRPRLWPRLIENVEKRRHTRLGYVTHVV
ncbi:uncharacterized protein LOC111674288 [Orussus abietinus]|uniref:uncharacterized protein LOC111674288 n=1 Tax=Orussus abietinus TaxID=222816 RepID=UPI000C715E36|nr:uncharacterized protein LOC111674288 [Orussus abietinus]